MSERKLTCEERDEILIDFETNRYFPDIKVVSGLTDLDGEFGDPIMDTTWETAGGIRVRDVRHPAFLDAENPADRKPCEHYLVERVATK